MISRYCTMRSPPDRRRGYPGPRRRSRSPFGARRRSRSWSPKRKPPPYSRGPPRRSPSPRGRFRKSRSPMRQRSPKPRSPRRRMSRSPRRRRSLSPRARRSPSPRARRSRSPKPSSTRSPRARKESWQRSKSKSPLRRQKQAVVQEAESTVKEDIREPSWKYAEAQASAVALDYDARTAPLQHRFDQTNISFNHRFTEECDNPLNFLPKENITVGIDRNIAGNAPAVVGGALIADQVIITRRRGEGEVPLYQRSEFLGPQDDDLSERRVIRVAKGESQSGLQGRDNFEVRRPMDGDERGKDKNLHGDRDERVSFKKQQIFATGFGDRDERLVVNRTEDFDDEDFRSSRTSEHSDRKSHDLRHNLSKRRKEESGFDARQKISRRHESSRSKEDVGRSRKRSESDLPDFSQRPGKGFLEEWKIKPELIPKGGNYYEHDNRGEHDYWERRGRGRGRGRGRPWRGRGTWIDRRPSRGSRDEHEWKHDKFKELEEETPSSTTK